MEWVVVGFLAAVVATLTFFSLLVLLLHHRLQRRHRVDPKVPTSAPLTWLADPRHPARLHRRLAKVGHAATTVADDHRVRPGRFRKAVEQPPIVELAERICRQATAVDQQLTRSAMLPSAPRREQFARVTAAVADLEAAVARLVPLGVEIATPPVLASETHDLLDLAGQVDRLRAAHAELLAIDAAHGLRPAGVTPTTGRATGPATPGQATATR